MKKMIAIVAVTVFLAACGGASTETPATTDSTSVKTDSTVSLVDSTRIVDSVEVAK